MVRWVKRRLLLTLATEFDPWNSTVKERIGSTHPWLLGMNIPLTHTK